MKRRIYSKLLEWKSQRSQMPLMLIGARQVGKTYILDQFCKNEYEEYFYINLERESEIRSVFEETIEPEEIINRILIEKESHANPDKAVFFFDEVQVSERAIVSLKYFNESDINYNIVCAGSLLGVVLNRFKSSYPVGKVWQMNLYPMDIGEFFEAAGYGRLMDEVSRCYKTRQSMGRSLHTKALGIYRDYIFVGGMPACVLEYINKDNKLSRFDRNVKRTILDSYMADMTKYASNSETVKISKVYRSIPNQLSRKNGKFRYSDVEKRGDKRMFESPLDWLISSRLVYRSVRTELVQLPLSAYENDSYFKLFLNDVGLLAELSDMNPVDLISDEMKLFRGYFTENYIAQAFVSNGLRLSYWEKSGSTAEIDFLLTIDGHIIPVEVKASENTKSKSLRIYREKEGPVYAIRVSSKDFGESNGIVSIPLYAAHLIGSRGKDSHEQ